MAFILNSVKRICRLHSWIFEIKLYSECCNMFCFWANDNWSAVETNVGTIFGLKYRTIFRPSNFYCLVQGFLFERFHVLPYGTRNLIEAYVEIHFIPCHTKNQADYNSSSPDMALKYAAWNSSSPLYLSNVSTDFLYTPTPCLNATYRSV